MNLVGPGASWRRGPVGVFEKVVRKGVRTKHRQRRPCAQPRLRADADPAEPAPPADTAGKTHQADPADRSDRADGFPAPPSDLSGHRFDDEDYPAYSMGRAAEMLGVTQAFLRNLGAAKPIEPQRSEGDVGEGMTPCGWSRRVCRDASPTAKECRS